MSVSVCVSVEIKKNIQVGTARVGMWDFPSMGLWGCVYEWVDVSVNVFCVSVSVCLLVLWCSGAQLADLSDITDNFAQVRPLCTFCKDQRLKPATRGSKLTNKRKKNSHF